MAGKRKTVPVSNKPSPLSPKDAEMPNAMRNIKIATSRVCHQIGRIEAPQMGQGVYGDLLPTGSTRSSDQQTGQGAIAE
jgi:hypothetical protein